MNQNHYGVFISYRRSYSFFAGRIHDFLANKGMAPFMDVYRMKQDYFDTEIVEKIQECPYFLLVLGNGCFDSISKTDVFFMEIRTALQYKSPDDILIVAEKGFNFPAPELLPQEFQQLPRHQCDIITHEHFMTDMDRFIENIRLDRLIGVLNWRERMIKNGSTTVTSRSLIENKLAPLENRFGQGLVEAVRNGQHYDGFQIVKQIRMACYAASIIFNPARNMVDNKAYDNGLLFNIFGELLRDPEFSLEILINAPGSFGAQEAIRNDMLGNSALEEHPEAVFLGAYAGINRLIEEVPEFNQAYREKRFRFYLTDTVMTGAIFQMEYKAEWSEFDHIKYDIYSYNLVSNMDRRCMLFFRLDNNDNYEHMIKAYNYMKRHRYKKEDVQSRHEAWMQEWELLQEEI